MSAENFICGCQNLLFHWLTVAEIVRFDSSLCKKSKRAMFLFCCCSNPTSVLINFRQNDLDLARKLIAWMSFKQINFDSIVFDNKLVCKQCIIKHSRKSHKVKINTCQNTSCGVSLKKQDFRCSRVMCIGCCSGIDRCYSCGDFLKSNVIDSACSSDVFSASICQESEVEMLTETKDDITSRGHNISTKSGGEFGKWFNTDNDIILKQIIASHKQSNSTVRWAEVYALYREQLMMNGIECGALTQDRVKTRAHHQGLCGDKLQTRKPHKPVMFQSPVKRNAATSQIGLHSILKSAMKQNKQFSSVTMPVKTMTTQFESSPSRMRSPSKKARSAKRLTFSRFNVRQRAAKFGVIGASTEEKLSAERERIVVKINELRATLHSGGLPHFGSQHCIDLLNEPVDISDGHSLEQITAQLDSDLTELEAIPTSSNGFTPHNLVVYRSALTRILYLVGLDLTRSEDATLPEIVQLVEQRQKVADSFSQRLSDAVFDIVDADTEHLDALGVQFDAWFDGVYTTYCQALLKLKSPVVPAVALESEFPVSDVDDETLPAGDPDSVQAVDVEPLSEVDLESVAGDGESDWESGDDSVSTVEEIKPVTNCAKKRQSMSSCLVGVYMKGIPHRKVASEVVERRVARQNMCLNVAGSELSAEQQAYVHSAPNAVTRDSLRGHLVEISAQLREALAVRSETKQIIRRENIFTPEERAAAKLHLSDLNPQITALESEYLKYHYLMAKQVHLLKRYDQSCAESHPEHSANLLSAAVLLVEMSSRLCTLFPVRAKCDALMLKVLGVE